MSATRVVFWTAMALWGAVEIRTAITHWGRDTGEDQRTHAWSLGACLGGLLAAVLVEQLTPELVGENDQAAFLATGAALVVTGIALRVWSIRTLGRYFTYRVMTTQDQPVITSGPYRFVRHPSYSALLLSCLGAGVATANLVSMIVAVTIPAMGLTVRMRVEERTLGATLGEEYRAFAATRKRIIPGIW